MAERITYGEDQKEETEERSFPICAKSTTSAVTYPDVKRVGAGDIGFALSWNLTSMYIFLPANELIVIRPSSLLGSL